MRQSFLVPVQNPTEDVTHVEICAFYCKAGMSHFTYQHRAGGCYLSFKPVCVKDGMQSFMLFSGTHMLVEPANRLNRKKEETILAQAQAEVTAKTGRLWEFVETFLSTEGLLLAA